MRSHIDDARADVTAIACSLARWIREERKEPGADNDRRLHIAVMQDKLVEAVDEYLAVRDARSTRKVQP